MLTIRLRDSIYSHINTTEFIKFAREFIDSLDMNELDTLNFSLISDSIKDLKISNSTEEFIEGLIKNNICKSKAEVIRFLMFHYILTSNEYFFIYADTDSIKFKKGG